MLYVLRRSAGSPFFFGLYPSFRQYDRILLFMSGLTRPLPDKALDTVVFEHPAASAMSSMVIFDLSIYTHSFANRIIIHYLFYTVAFLPSIRTLNNLIVLIFCSLCTYCIFLRNFLKICFIQRKKPALTQAL